MFCHLDNWFWCPKTLAQLAEQFQEMKTVRIIAEDILAFVPASGDMIPRYRPPGRSMRSARAMCL
jgi:hypothetical protein